ncbi:hypothetical protein [Paenibacillus sp. UMB4589-SE434]|uniref:hypothetical protein n=1 Tax=Paenibacillus sp. UMB4589-SE434 TaxID=3046314 RepID=UPI00254BDF74|nr:hypothetical protein [Paenibacillus sp. UMB4589-SE434]MDK8181107.1 hypothetical protein [Paenibacillus sp. UMB4589-SE434]
MTLIMTNRVEDPRFGRSLRLDNERYTMIIPLDYGIRIMHFSLRGGENVLFHDAEGVVAQQGEAFRKMGSDGWLLRGGHRLWVSPEAYPRTYSPDDQPIDWSPTGQGVVLTSPVEQWSLIKKQIEIVFTEDQVVLTHRITNEGAYPIQVAPWSINVMAQGGTAIIPQTKRETGLLPNRAVVLWPYSRMNDDRVVWGENHITIRQSPDADRAFKLGTGNEPGWAAYLNNGTAFEISHEHQSDAEYPDGSCSFECYTNEHMLELETLGPLSMLGPGQTASHRECWRLTAALDKESFLASKQQ